MAALYFLGLFVNGAFAGVIRYQAGLTFWQGFCLTLPGYVVLTYAYSAVI